MREEEYKDYGLPTYEEIEQHCKPGMTPIEVAEWMRDVAVEVIDKINEGNLKALAKILSDK